MAEWQDITPMVLEVEVVILGDDGRPDAARLATRRTDGLTRARVLTQAKRHPATVIVNELLWFDGHPLDDAAARKRTRDRLDLKGPTWTAATVTDDGKALLAAVSAQGLPGVRARREPSELIGIGA